MLSLPGTHLHHALTVKAALPVGSLANNALFVVKKLLSAASATEPLAAPKTPVEYEMPASP